MEELSQIKDKSRPVIFSAHGVPKSVHEEASNKNMFYIDATCPLVTKVNREAERHNKNGYKIILIGHKGHPEVIGTMGQIQKDNIVLIETIEDAKKLELEGQIAYVTQTTLSVDDTQEIIKVLQKRFPSISGPRKDDICYATQNRQDAVKQLALECDLILVIGSKNSSNSNRLREIAERSGVESHLIDTSADLNLDWFHGKKVLGITSGASAPEHLVQELLDTLGQNFDIDLKKGEDRQDEGIFFKLPKELRN